MTVFFFILQRKQVLKFHVNGLPSRRFTWNAKTCFLWKIKKNFLNVVCYKFCLMLQGIMLSMLGKLFQYVVCWNIYQQMTYWNIFLIFFPVNRHWHFMQIGKNKKIFQYAVCWKFHPACWALKYRSTIANQDKTKLTHPILLALETFLFLPLNIQYSQRDLTTVQNNCPPSLIK